MSIEPRGPIALWLSHAPLGAFCVRQNAQRDALRAVGLAMLWPPFFSRAREKGHGDHNMGAQYAVLMLRGKCPKRDCLAFNEILILVEYVVGLQPRVLIHSPRNKIIFGICAFRVG